MTLIESRTVAGPGLHALIVGVSDYPHLPRHDEPPPAEWGTRSLASPALSAFRLAEWIRGAGDLAYPLKSLRLLISPTQTEEAPTTGVDKAVPDLQNFRRAVVDWRKSCAASPQDLALFYYAGHGFARGRSDTNLLLTMDDFLVPGTVPLGNTVAAANIINGMAPQKAGDTVARNQIFFFDCCRSFPDEMADLDDREVTGVLPVRAAKGVIDDRLIDRIYAVPDFNAAFAKAGTGTYFSKALLDALERSGRGVKGAWHVDSLALVDRIRCRYLMEANRNVDAFLSGNGPRLRNLAAPPLIDIEVQLEPTADAMGRNVGLHRDILYPGVPQSSGKHALEVQPGEYTLQVSADGGVSWRGTSDRQLIMPDFASPWISRNWQ